MRCETWSTMEQPRSPTHPTTQLPPSCLCCLFRGYSSAGTDRQPSLPYSGSRLIEWDLNPTGG